MRKVSTEQIFALVEKEKGKFFNISFINEEKKYSIERIFSNKYRNSVIEEHFEEKDEEYIGQEDWGKFEEEEFEVVGEEAQSIGVSFKNEGISVVVLLVESFEQTLVNFVYGHT